MSVENSDVSFNFVAADIRLVAHLQEDGMWFVECGDTLSNKTITAVWPYKVIGACLFLLAGTGEEEGTDPELTQLMYAIVEPCIKDWPPELRPIP